MVQVKTAYEVKSAYDGVMFPKSDARDARYTQYVVATAYSSEVGQTDDTPCIPAMWTFDLCEYYDTYGVADSIAANDLPLGTKVRFPELYGDKIFTVRDRMNARYTGKSRIDFWMPTRPEAVHFGVKRIKMEVL
jgi:3D (Asp-Asp-Asp) domain-containing protein